MQSLHQERLKSLCPKALRIFWVSRLYPASPLAAASSFVARR